MSERIEVVLVGKNDAKGALADGRKDLEQYKGATADVGKEAAKTGDAIEGAGRKAKRAGSDVDDAAAAVRRHADALRTLQRDATAARTALEQLDKVPMPSTLGGGGGSGRARGASGGGAGGTKHKGLFAFLDQLSPGAAGGGGIRLAGSLGSTAAANPTAAAAIAAYLAPVGIGAGVAGMAAASAGAGAALGGGAMALGAMGAMRGGDAKMLERQYSDVFDRITARWLKASEVFSRPMMDVSRAIERVSDKFPLEKALKAAAGYADQLVAGIEGLATGAGQGAFEWIEALGPVFKEVRQELGEWGDDLAMFGESMADSADGGAKALGDLMDLIGLGIRLTGVWVEAFAKLYDWFSETPPYDWIVELLNLMNPDRPRSFGTEFGGVQDEIKGVEETVDDLRAKLDALFDTFMSADEANLAFAESMAKLKEELKDGKRTLDINTEAGRANVAAMLDSISAAERVREAQINAGVSVDQANATFHRSVGAIRAQMAALGFNKKEIDNYIAKYMQMYNLPDVHNNVFTHFSETGARAHVANSAVRGQSRGRGTHSGGVSLSGYGEHMINENPWGNGELVKLPNGSLVIPAGTSQALLSNAATGGAGGGGGLTVLELRSSGSAMDEMLIALLRRAINTRGGNAQVVLTGRTR